MPVETRPNLIFLAQICFLLLTPFSLGSTQLRHFWNPHATRGTSVLIAITLSTVWREIEFRSWDALEMCLNLVTWLRIGDSLPPFNHKSS
jgi:hypothetical protein